MRVVITGSRTITDYEIVKFCLDNSPFEIDYLILGGCRSSKDRKTGRWRPEPSVDKLAVRWAYNNNIMYREVEPDWNPIGFPNNLYDSRAALKRDEEMVRLVAPYGGLIGIWDGESTGTEYTIRMAEKYNIDYVYWMIEDENYQTYTS
jgi:hypothetical protein